ncbi:hypothetical protein OROMI_006491 [Orobanche minor]
MDDVLDQVFDISSRDMSDMLLNYDYGTPSLSVQDEQKRSRVWDDTYVMSYDGLDYSDSADSADMDVFTPSGSDTFHGSLANFFKSGMLSDTSNDTSMIQGSRREEKSWEFCGFSSTSAGASGGFYTLPALSSVALAQLMQYAGCSRTSKVWTHDVSHAIAETDPCVGSRGTRDCLISMLGKNQMPDYFKNAQTEVYFLAGGTYEKYRVPWILEHKVRKLASAAASEQFVKRLALQQPKQQLLGSEDTIYQLQWYYSPEHGLGFHGLWVGEIHSYGGRSFVRCVNNDIKKEPYASQLRKVVEKVRNLPADLLEEMERSWTSRPALQSIVYYAASQFLKHAVQGVDFLVEDYWPTATELSRLLTNDKLEEIMERNNFQRGRYYPCEDLRVAVSEELKAEVRVTFRPHPEHGVVPYGFTALRDYQFCPINHVNIDPNYDYFTFV